jgi:hypothetical protein
MKLLHWLWLSRFGAVFALGRIGDTESVQLSSRRHGEISVGVVASKSGGVSGVLLSNVDERRLVLTLVFGFQASNDSDR